uniref:Uncharacterized protein n=1 Tax=Trypanosoma congolense (strain IL3000) TaxID=1068625 RepID=G0UTP6_TRYCI|nr:conserved hypothetical protein [Trypanosoma congolense IL3000]
MTTSTEAAKVEKVRRTLASLGYYNPSTEDIALTLEQMGRVRESRDAQPIVHGLNPHQARASSHHEPRNTTGDLMGGDYGPRSGEGVESNTPADMWARRVGPPQSMGGDRAPYSTLRESRHKVSGGILKHEAEQHNDTAGARPRSRGAADDGGRRALRLSSGNGRREVRTKPRFRPMALHKTPEARLEQHIKHYERGLTAALAARYVGDSQDEFPSGRNEWVGDSRECEDGFCNYVDDYYEDGFDGNLAMYYGGRSHNMASPRDLAPPNAVALDQRSANTMYSFTGDARYKYRSGSGLPLSTVLGPDGSTLRTRADPVRRGQQMRELWKKDKFLAQHGRKEDRWRVRQTMLNRTLQ